MICISPSLYRDLLEAIEPLAQAEAQIPEFLRSQRWSIVRDRLVRARTDDARRTVAADEDLRDREIDEGALVSFLLRKQAG